MLTPIKVVIRDGKPDVLVQLYDDGLDGLSDETVDISSSVVKVVGLFYEKGTDLVIAASELTKLLGGQQGICKWVWPSKSLDDIDPVRHEIEIFKSDSSETGTITAATAASPVSVTSAAHGLETGDEILITGVSGLTNATTGKSLLNYVLFKVTVVDANTFTLTDTEDASVNGSGYAAYISGGTWTHYLEVETVKDRAQISVGEDVGK